VPKSKYLNVDTTITLKWILGKQLENVRKWVKLAFINTIISLQVLKPPSQAKTGNVYTS